MRVYYGWYITAIALLINTLTAGTTFIAFGLFVIPVAEDFDISRANANTALIFLNFGIAFTAPFIGRMLDHYSLQRIMLLFGLCFGASFIILGLSRNIWLSAAIVALPLAAATCTGSLTANTLVARWFTVHRGRAMAIAAVGLALGGVVLVPPIGLLIDAVGWRYTLIVMGTTLSTIIVLLVPFTRDRPGPDDVEVESADGESQDKTANATSHVNTTPLKTPELLRMAQFWTICISVALAFGAMQTIGITLVPLAKDMGVSTAQAATLVAFMSAGAVTGKLSFAVVADRFNRITLLTTMFFILAITNIILLFSSSYLMLALCAGFMGLTSGAIAPAFFALLADRFGQSSFGTVNGLSLPILSIIGAICLRYGGEVFDRTGGYDFLFITFIVTSLLATAMMFTTHMLSRSVSKPEVPAQVIP